MHALIYKHINPWQAQQAAASSQTSAAPAQAEESKPAAVGRHIDTDVLLHMHTCRCLPYIVGQLHRIVYNNNLLYICRYFTSTSGQ